MLRDHSSSALPREDRGIGASVQLKMPVDPDRPIKRRPSPLTRSVLEIARIIGREPISIGELLDRLGTNGIGLVLLVLTLIALIPIPGPFGMVSGSLIALVAVQVLAGSRALWLPAFLRRGKVPAAALRNIIARALPWLRRGEYFLKEDRLPILAGRHARIILAVPLLLLAVAIILPIPFGNVAPAIALITFALGFIARDGTAILIALIFSMAALAWTALILLSGAALIERFTAMM
ncbi:MAG: exopolysaccharide biosynthesis protein [Rhizobiales bacterium]|nr:exopolysaccharide biosynthesis protein [Hyphomicrobiales bacterium]